MNIDVIVNAANSQLKYGGGVCGAIYDSAGPELEDITDIIGYCQTGDAIITPGFDLPASWIVHAVGPIWSEGKYSEKMMCDLLASAYRSSIREADSVEAKTIAFPAISTGIFGFPADLAASIAVDTLSNIESEYVETVILVGHSDRSLSILQEAVKNANIPSL
jgi:hypothetical protein